jgi:hypothetical protein
VTEDPVKRCRKCPARVPSAHDLCASCAERASFEAKVPIYDQLGEELRRNPLAGADAYATAFLGRLRSADGNAKAIEHLLGVFFGAAMHAAREEGRRVGAEEERDRNADLRLLGKVVRESVEATRRECVATARRVFDAATERHFSAKQALALALDALGAMADDGRVAA